MAKDQRFNNPFDKLAKLKTELTEADQDRVVAAVRSFFV